jgi:very-short-patch-repair endonuclease
MSSKSEVNESFLAYWNSKHPKIKAVSEHEPFKEKWKNSDTDMPIRKWMQKNNFNNYRIDFCILDFKLAVEFDGAGGGHNSPRQIERDRQKQNALVLEGWIVLRFSVSTVKQSPQYVEDTILKCLNSWFSF